MLANINWMALMNNWRDAILDDFVLGINKLTLVADPDNLLTEEKLALTLREQGFNLIEFDDPIEFRYAYELNYRSIWDRGEHINLVVRSQSVDLKALPYDLLQAGRKLSFNLGELFPNLSYSVLENLDHSFLDDLFDAQHKFNPDHMGDNATKDFILRYVFSIAAELISNDVDLLKVLLHLHYGKIQIPPMLANRLVQVLVEQGNFKAYSLSKIVLDDEAFFAFLQERWTQFLDSQDEFNQFNGDAAIHNFRYSGPEVLPFGHQDIKVYINNLFIEGILEPIQANGATVDNSSWIRCGIASNSLEDGEVRFTRLLKIIEDNFPTESSRYSDWTTFAQKWAELSVLVHCGKNTAHQSSLKHVGDRINTTFSKWLIGHYSSLINLPPSNPVMLHHVPRRLARDINPSDDRRVALIVMDGLSLDQWVTVRRLLQKHNNNLLMHESTAFAWIPTLTSVSRQSLFSGKPPFYFSSSSSIHTTNNEEKLWKQFWEEQGLSKSDVVYQRGLTEGEPSEALGPKFHPDKTKVIGLVVDMVDKIMHGMQNGSAGMHNQIKQWCEKKFLGNLIEYLLDSGYETWLTSDHGNIECDGGGRPSEGSIAETRGERVRVYPTQELRSQVAGAHAFSCEWPSVGLPNDYMPLVARGRSAFIKAGETIVGHGGIAIEEVIVPLIKFSRKE